MIIFAANNFTWFNETNNATTLWIMNIRCVFILLAVFANMCASAQNKYTVEADIERAVKEFFYKISEMNNPVEPIHPESFAAAYQKGINVFKVNDVSLKM